MYENFPEHLFSRSLPWAASLIFEMKLPEKIKSSNLCIRYEFFDTNYRKCSNDFAADCRFGLNVGTTKVNFLVLIHGCIIKWT